MLYDYFKTSEHMSQVYSYSHLIELQWYGDHRIADFLRSWDMIWDNLEERDTLPDSCKRDLFAKQVEQSSVLKTEFTHYKRQLRKARSDPTTTECDFEFLYNACQCYLDDNEEKKRTAEVKDSFRQMAKGKGTGFTWKGMATPGKGAPEKGGGKTDRGGADRRSRSAPAPRHRDSPTKTNNTVAVPAEERCWFHSAAAYGKGQGCKYGSSCNKSHDLMPKDVFDKMPKPRKPEVDVAAAKGASKSKGKGKGKTKSKGSKGKEKGRSQSPYSGAIRIKHCWKFLKTGKCDWEEKHGTKCSLPHLTQAEYDKKLEELKKKGATGTKGKGKSKGKSKGRGRGKGAGSAMPAVAGEEYDGGAESFYTADEWAEWENDYGIDSEWDEGDYAEE